ncbi:MAG: RluA family pseudouridine synthase [Armatimonadetes bacterium]|nr:RluA family pseudouridine synthase [Armatimonadota bacterium]
MSDEPELFDEPLEFEDELYEGEAEGLPPSSASPQATEGTEAGETFRLNIPVEWAGYRIDRVLATAFPDHSRSLLQRLILDDEVKVDGRTYRPSHKVKEGDEVVVHLPPSGPPPLIPEPIPLDIRYEDDQLLVIHKPRGMVVHPAPGAHTGTLVHAVLAHCPEGLSRVGGEGRPGIVHRLDKDTSGLILVAKTDVAHRSLSKQIQARSAERRYIALVWGEPRFQKALVDAPIGRHPVERKRMAVLALSGPGDSGPRSRAAQTELSVTERFGFCTLLECRLLTGRTHQIRVHCAHIGHPVVGDQTYGKNQRTPPEAFHDTALRSEFDKIIAAMGGQALHAYSLAFDHPQTGERLTFTSDPPEDFAELMTFLHTFTRHR